MARPHPLLVVAAAFVALAGVAKAQLNEAENNGYYNPCQAAPTGGNNASSPVLVGDPFVFGISYWPGYTVTNWGPPFNTAAGQPGLNPCIGSVTLPNMTVNYQDYLGNRSAVMTTYVVKVDTLSVVRSSSAEMLQLFRSIPATRVKAMSMIAFRGQNRSEARYSISDDDITYGKGVAEQMGLIFGWNKGSLESFEWFDFQSCAACGGIYSSQCIRLPEDPVIQQYPQTTCAAKFDDCNCGTACTKGNCTTSIYIAHRGTDRKGRVMQSAYQLDQLNSLSFTNWFSEFWQKIDSAYDNTDSIIGSGEIGKVQAAVSVDINSEAALAANAASAKAAAAEECTPGFPCDKNNP